MIFPQKTVFFLLCIIIIHVCMFTYGNRKKMDRFRIRVPHVTFLIIFMIALHPVNTVDDGSVKVEKVTSTLDVNLAATQLPGNISLVDKILSNQTLQECTKTIALLVGWLPVKGEIDKEGIYSRIVQAYHYSWPSVDFWYEALREYQNNRQALISIREMQRDWEYLRSYNVTCTITLAILKKEKKDENYKEAEDEMKKCLFGDVISQVRSTQFEKRLLKMAQNSLDVVLNALLLSSDNTQVKQLNKPFEVALFARMYNETLLWDLEIHDKLNNSFPQYIQKLKEEGKDIQANETEKKFVEIQKRMKEYPYNLLYFGGDEDAIEEFRKSGDTGFESLAFEIYNLFYDTNTSTTGGGGGAGAGGGGGGGGGGGTSIIEARNEPGIETETKKPYYQSREDWAYDFNNFERDWKDGTFETYRIQAERLYQKYLHVETMPEEGRAKSERNEKGILIGDGMWAWDIEANGIQNMRLAWDMMGAVVEEIKCYLQESYYFDLRETALKNTQLGFEEEGNKLFSGISRTMFTGCRIINQTDLVTPYCTRENHEICAPIGPLDNSQRPESSHHGGLSILKPKWIFELKENKTSSKRECVGRKDYVIQMNFCRCGFRMDCGKDLDENITCQLENNDMLRGQCRGGVGYPCRTLPLAKGKFHQTCKSGYCNLRTNSCEDRPSFKRGIGYKVGGNGKLILICLLKLAVIMVYFLH